MPKIFKKQKSKKVYRVGIDARFFGLQNKGLGRYTNELVVWLDRICREKQNIGGAPIEYYIFLKNNNFDEYQPRSDNIYKIKADYNWYSWGEQFKYLFLLKKYKLDLMHFTHFNAPIFYGGRFIVTIHDLILFHYPTVKNTTLNKFSYLIKLVAYHLVIRVIARRAYLIVAISKFTKNDIVKSLKVSKNKVKVIYEGTEFDSANNSAEEGSNESAVFEKYGIMKPYLLYVGNAYPHKNLERLVLVFEKVQNKVQKKLQLVLVGKKDYFYERLEEFIRKKKIKNIIITDYISDKDLDNLYQGANFFVFPSLYEGFGLPPLEALVKKIPVVSSDKSSLPEILGDKVKYFNPNSITSMVNAIEEVILNGGRVLGEQEISKIKKKYSWKKMSKEIIILYGKLVQ